MKKIVSFCLLCILLLGVFSGCASEKKEGYKIAIVPKVIFSGWFQRMEQGVSSYNEEHGTDYFFGGSTEVSEQVSYVEQLLAEDWDAICIVPYDPESIAPLLEKAKKEGIVVITHEADAMDEKCYDYGIEAFSSESLGQHYAEYLIEKTGGKGTYIQFVETLNAASHNLWCNAADEYFAANSQMVKLGRYETNNSATSAYNQVKELLQAHPEITAIECSCSDDLIGVPRALKELGLVGKVAVIGTSLTSICGEYIEDGTLETFSLWDPAKTAQAMISLAEQILTEGDAFDPDNCSIPVEGYENMERKGRVYYGNARADVTKENISEYDY